MNVIIVIGIATGIFGLFYFFFHKKEIEMDKSTDRSHSEQCKRTTNLDLSISRRIHKEMLRDTGL